MDPKELLIKEISAKFSEHFSEQTISEKIEQFFKHGTTFLLLELVSLRREVESLRDELQYQRKKKRIALSAQVVP